MVIDLNRLCKIQGCSGITAVLFIIMLRIKSEGKKHDIAEIRKEYKKRLRQQQLQKLFQSIRYAIINSPDATLPVESQNVIIQPQQPQAPPFILYLPPNYNQQLSYLMQLPSLPYAQLGFGRPQPFSLQIAAEPPSNIYFQSNGIVVFKKELGSGSYSKVWQGKVLATGVKVAAKEVQKLQPNQLKCLQQLTSEYIVKVIDIITHQGKCFIILEFCDRNLRDELMDCGFKLERVLKYFEEIIYGMDVLQSRNILHRDLKFQNILVKEGKIKLADFGLAKFMGQQLQVESRRCGTPYTMAPEVYFCKSKTAPYTIKSDIWSIGVILHEMLYQLHPFGANSEKFQKQRRVKIVRKYGILDQLIDQCLTTEPILRIEWNDFKALFCIYLNEKHLYPIQARPKQVSPTAQRIGGHQMMKKNKKFYEDVARPFSPVKMQARQKQEEREDSRQFRKERTPPKRNQYKSPLQADEARRLKHGYDRFEEVKEKTPIKTRQKVPYEDKKREGPQIPPVPRPPPKKLQKHQNPQVNPNPPQQKRQEPQSKKPFSVTQLLIILTIVLTIIVPFIFQ